MKAVNPATEELIRDYPELSPAEIDDRVATAERAFGCWRWTELSERCERLHRLALLLRWERTDLARGITEEMGKPITASEAEIEKCALVCDFYAERVAGFLAPLPVAAMPRGATSVTTRWGRSWQ